MSLAETALARGLGHVANRKLGAKVAFRDPSAGLKCLQLPRHVQQNAYTSCTESTVPGSCRCDPSSRPRISAAEATCPGIALAVAGVVFHN